MKYLFLLLLFIYGCASSVSLEGHYKDYGGKVEIEFEKTLDKNGKEYALVPYEETAIIEDKKYFLLETKQNGQDKK
jgi:hypothetical protein